MNTIRTITEEFEVEDERQIIHYPNDMFSDLLDEVNKRFSGKDIISLSVFREKPWKWTVEVRYKEEVEE